MAENTFYGLFMQILRKIGVAVGPNEIAPLREKCDELVKEMRNVAKEEATAICIKQVNEIKEIVSKLEAKSCTCKKSGQLELLPLKLDN